MIMLKELRTEFFLLLSNQYEESMHLAICHHSRYNKNMPEVKKKNEEKIQSWTKRFIKKYRPALVELSKK
jgi:hypothetical protein